MNWLTKILKKEKEAGKKEQGSHPAVLVKEKSKDVEVKFEQARGKFSSDAFWAHHLTEKASFGKAKDKYIFKVFPRANKAVIKRAVEAHFGVNVRSVNIVNTLGKEIRRGKQIGRRSGLKKAIVTLEKGQNIEAQ